MADNIIKLTKSNDWYTCLLCCEKVATVKMQILRPKYQDGVISFDICDECLSKAQQDIHKICE